ncbi:MAG: hypothetical protein KA271_06490 [Propionivibrio sp.]|nr:hypothetical protein [Propionivibrio sp.]
MKPKHFPTAGTDAVLRSLISCVSSIDCSTFSKGSDRTKTERVKGLQSSIMAALKRAFPRIEWTDEYCPNSMYRDRIDIFGKGREYVVVVELDTTRADQVAKKFVSRSAILAAKQVYYLSVCYPGTDNMNAAECKKYFGFCAVLARRMHTHFGGFIIAKSEPT